MIQTSSSQQRRACWTNWVPLGLLAVVTSFLAGCAGMGGGSGGTYHVTAYAPHSNGDVRVLVSLRSKIVYVMEGDRPLMITPASIGTPDKPTPTGHFTVTDKDATKRSSEYGFWTNGSDTHPGEAGARPGPGYHYVGYPMANWVGFEPGYGFHEGYVWPVPRSHGCLRIHKNASVKFFELVHIGTPVIIENSLPEDETIGRNIEHPTDYKDPDPPASFMISPQYFSQPRDSTLIQGSSSGA